MAPDIPQLPSLCIYEHSSKDKSKHFHVYNPATGAIITTVAGGDKETTLTAIKIAKETYETKWRHTTLFERSQLLFKCAQVLEDHREELATLLCMENGKPMQDALNFDVKFIVGVFRYFASLIDKLPAGEFYDRGHVDVKTVREPHGVTAGILPFNWPPIHTGGKTAPSLAAGNVMVLKPGEQAPLTCLRIVELLQTVLPSGVLQAVPGFGIEVPSAIIESRDVRFISFTGSTPAGAAVAGAAAKTLKPTHMELGGKNAVLIFDDADLDKAAKDALEGAFFNKGEACTAASRMIVQEGIHDKFVEKLGKAVQKLKVGDGMKSDTHVGPAVSKTQQDKLLEYLRVAVEDDKAEIAAQAPVPSDPALKDGYFIPATLIKNVTRNMRIAQEEMFGPIVTVTKFKDEEEALSIANESQYGLVAAVFTGDPQRANRVARRLEAGMVYVNNYNRNLLGLPFGGIKDSGYGREHNIHTLDDWTTRKFIQSPSGVGKIMQWRSVDEIFKEI